MTLGFTDAAVCILALIGLLGVYYKRRPTHQYPPGPKPYPLIGNVLDIPDKHPYLQYAQWAREYGQSSTNLYPNIGNVLMSRSWKTPRSLDYRF